MFDGAEHNMIHLVALGVVLQRLVFLDADKCAGNDDEAGQEDPCAEGGE